MSELPKKQSGIFKWIIIGVIVIGIAGAALGDKDNSVKRVDSSEDTIQKESRKRHPYEYEKYLPDTGLIINSPDYVGLSPKDSWALVSKLQALEEERDGPEVELARAEIKKPRLTGEMIGERPSFNFLQYKRKRTAL